MKKRILCLILTVLMLFSAMPLTVFADQVNNESEEEALPVVSVSSLYKYDNGSADQFRALPDNSGTFYFDIALDKAPKTNENIIVYYRTVDDSAVSKWGDYQSVGTLEETYVTLTKANGYKARVSVSSIILGDAYSTSYEVDYGYYKDIAYDNNKVVSRRFIFELTRVVGNAVLHTPAAEGERDQSELYCYLKASRYHEQTDDANIDNTGFKARSQLLLDEMIEQTMYELFGEYYYNPDLFYKDHPDATPEEVEEAILFIAAVEQLLFGEKDKYVGDVTYDSYYELLNPSSALYTPHIQYKGSHWGNVNLRFSDKMRDYVSSGLVDLGITIDGTITRQKWDSHGPATFNLYYNHGGERKIALTLYLEGEFDDSTFFGWEHAYEHTIEGITADERKDHMKDNFVGYTLYDNDQNPIFTINKYDYGTDSKIYSGVVNLLQDSLRDGYAEKLMSPFGDVDDVDEKLASYYLKLPSNFIFADSYSYEFISDSTKESEIRWLENVQMGFSLMSNENPMIAKNENKMQLVTTNIETMREGDPLRMSVRFNRPVYIADPNDKCYVTADIYNDKGACLAKGVKLSLKQFDGVNAEGKYYYYANDTLVFEAELPASLDNTKISSVRNIKIEDGKEEGTTEGIKSFFTKRDILSRVIYDIYVEKDLRTPVATINVKGGSENWAQSKSVDIYVSVLGNNNARFTDYVTVYYQWSNSKELPQTFDPKSKVVFHTNEDNEIVRNIAGTGNGEMYLHLKAVSSYGKVSISDALTVTYDPNDSSAVYTPFGPFKFDTVPPEISADDIIISGTLKEPTISIELPDDDGGSGLSSMSLYYIAKGDEDGEGTFLKKFTVDDFKGDPKTLTYTISHKDVGVGVDAAGKVVLERREVEFYWIISDNISNTSGKTARFTLVFDTHEYLDSEISNVGPIDLFDNQPGMVNFKDTTQQLDNFTFIYDYSYNKGKTTGEVSGKPVTYGFSFTITNGAFGETDNGTYGANIYYKGEQITNVSLESRDHSHIIWFHDEIKSGRYDIQFTRTEGESIRVSQIYSVYATDSEDDETAVKNKIETGTLLNNSVYQLTTDYYYKDSEGNRVQEYYNGTKQPATFSNEIKAKDYVYYKELGDIYLIELSSAIAAALNSGATGYVKATSDKDIIALEGQYWIRYKSEAWTPSAGDSGWVYYFYGTNGELSEGALSQNLQKALNAVSNRIVGYGKSVILTDTSLFLGSATGEKMLDQYGMPYLLEGQIHSKDEMSAQTVCGNKWKVQVSFAADRNIYKSNVSVGNIGSADYKEYPIVGNFALPEDSRFQYMTYTEYNSNSEWKPLDIKKGQTFINVFSASGVYYIREIAKEGVAVYAIYIDKEAPKVSFSNTDDQGNYQEIPIDGVDILNIRTKDFYIGSVADTEYDRLSYVAVYKVSNLDFVAVYTAKDLEGAYIKLDDGNYYVVVSDRSGNHYTVTAKISSTGLECDIKETPDKFIRLTCNRRNDQILSYEVYLNGELITDGYMADQTFKKAGLYTIFIQDIYGNVFSEEYLFNRNYPTVTWKYFGSDGKYHTYDPKDTSTNGFVMALVSDNQYKISTAVKMRFSFSENYEFEFIGAEPKYSKTIGAETVVTIEAGQSFTLKVSYKEHSDCYTIYSGVVDVTPPSLNVSADVDILTNGEYALFDKWIISGIVSMDDIYYSLESIGRMTVSNGGKVSSDIIKINANDANELSLFEVYLDGKLINHQDVNSGFSQVIVNQWGNYRVVAKDSLGNVAEFTFTNGMPDGLSYFVDGVEKKIELHGYLNFQKIDGKYVYTKTDYGNTDFKIDIKQEADIFMSVAVSGGNTEIYGLRVSNGKIYPLTYKIVVDKNGQKSVDLEVGEAILDMSSKDFKLNTEYVINKNGSHPIYASVSDNKVVSIKVYASDDTSKVVSIGARVEFVGSNTMFVSSEISKKLSNVSFKESGVQTNTDIRANVGFTIDESLFAGERISSISLYYSNLNDLTADNLSGRSNIYKRGKQYSDEGFYLLIVRNLYGNEKVYKIAISRNFGITSSVTFNDGYKIYYSKDYEKTLYSNNEITLDILDEDVKAVVTLNGAVYTGFVQKKVEGVTYLVFSAEGTYKVTLTDSYGNVITRQLEINKSTYTVADKLLTGYNEKALKRDEGYTNQKLSVNKAVYDSEGIYYLAVRYGENLTVLFDAFAEVPISSDAQRLVNIIGSQGDGVYTVICRNRYGAVVTKEIHYRGTPTLKLERTIRSKSDPETYDLNYALSLGFWSNNTLSFITDAKTYVFTINGSVSECPRTLMFENSGDYGSTEYVITYIDEYGFEYNFKAYLVRQNITINVPASVGGVEINGVLNTKNNVSITFADTAYATYTINSGEEIIYHSGDVLKKDGTYRFTVIDYAGNATTMSIRKDTVVEFSFIESDSESVIQNGSVVNSSKIGFKALNKDSAYIEKVLLNGVVQKDFTGSKFTEDGKWEIILRDELGNTAYFCFYIITHSQNGFAYTTPYEYRITEMWYDDGSGVQVSYMNFVNHTDFSSSFDFRENGKYKVVMTSDVTGATSTFEFTVNTNAPNVSLVGCNVGETTINDVTFSGYKVGDRIKIYKATKTGEALVEELEITSLSTKIPTITEGGKYRIVVESEAGVETELNFVRKHVMNTAGSIFILVIIGLAVIGLFTGLVYRNKSKTDD